MKHRKKMEQKINILRIKIKIRRTRKIIPLRMVKVSHQEITIKEILQLLKINMLQMLNLPLERRINQLLYQLRAWMSMVTYNFT
jgi:hypothetical protein